MNTQCDADKPNFDSTLPSRLRLTPAQRQKYQREIAIYHGMFGGTDIAMGDVQAWASLRATVPEMAEVDRVMAAYRRWERAFWRRAKRRKQSRV